MKIKDVTNLTHFPIWPSLVAMNLAKLRNICQVVTSFFFSHSTQLANLLISDVHKWMRESITASTTSSNCDEDILT